MQLARTLFIFLCVCLAGIPTAYAQTSSAQTGAANAAAPEPGFEFFRTEVQPIFLAKRGSNVRCIQCHTRSSGFRLQPLEDGAHFWTLEQSRLNYASARAFVVPGADPLQSRFLTHPLEASAGGDPFHGGGKHGLRAA